MNQLVESSINVEAVKKDKVSKKLPIAKVSAGMLALGILVSSVNSFVRDNEIEFLVMDSAEVISDNTKIDGTFYNVDSARVEVNQVYDYHNIANNIIKNLYENNDFTPQAFIIEVGSVFQVFYAANNPDRLNSAVNNTNEVIKCLKEVNEASSSLPNNFEVYLRMIDVISSDNEVNIDKLMEHLYMIRDNQYNL